MTGKRGGFFICFTGIDGTGKTTLAKLLVTSLREKGIDAHYVYARLVPRISKPVMTIGRFLFLRNKDISKNYTEYLHSKKRLLRCQIVSKIYTLILLCDYIIQVILKIKIPLMFGKNIVCDRYIYDTIITDIAIDMNYSEEYILDLLKKCFLLIPEPDFVFLIDAPEEIAYSRKDDVPSIEYLKARRQIYLKIGKKCCMFVLDGTKNIKELLSELESEVFP
ncbi:Thymidylate kinase [Archaeoglobus sulfaticallidus PM70-1]|uniref:dTMP kinase n=1 Tax=Archaeoglobus sulfaticallidus PM70-1 TaxID=387631 RepID=N0BIV7_9EURY|nr:thymidylate kinase [Archaeoglobus sulfaticallidus]AGK60070.1 Thymidylate kinase [Archaeoglobus sulfaticallidus PM70-1]